MIQRLFKKSSYLGIYYREDPDLPPSILEVGRQPRVVPSSRNAVRGYACRAFGSAIAVKVHCTSADRLAGSAASV